MRRTILRLFNVLFDLDLVLWQRFAFQKAIVRLAVTRDLHRGKQQIFLILLELYCFMGSTAVLHTGTNQPAVKGELENKERLVFFPSSVRFPFGL